MHASPEEFLSGVADFLGGYYFTLAIMNGEDRTKLYLGAGFLF